MKKQKRAMIVTGRIIHKSIEDQTPTGSGQEEDEEKVKDDEGIPARQRRRVPRFVSGVFACFCWRENSGYGSVPLLLICG